MSVRRALPADADAALALWTALHREHEALDPRYRLADDAPALWATDFRTWVRSDADRIWLAIDDSDVPVGLLTAHLHVPAPTFAADLLVHVDDLYVAPEARARGLARSLLDEARAWAFACGATEVRAGVMSANAAGRAFWAREGGRDFSVLVSIDLSEPGA